MNDKFNINRLVISLFNLFLIFLLFHQPVQAQTISLAIHLSGVSESKITLLPLSGQNALKPLTTVESVKNGKSATILISEDNLPGEFVLRFDYKENPASTPYPSEKRLIIYNQDLELWVNPIYCNNADSTWFQKDERENTTYVRFLTENTEKMKQLGLLQNFLMNYDDNNSSFYREAIIEYEKREEAYNLWISEQSKQYKTLFVSNIIGFHHIPPINWKGSETVRKQSLMENYFDGMNFTEPLMLKTTNMKEWMDRYVNLYGELATSITLRDSLFTLAGKTAIEKARSGHPLVYGWMVDYFFNGYESFNIEKGIKMLKPFLDDPDCLTSKRQEINKRLKGIETLLPGITAPNIIMDDPEGNRFELNTFKTGKKNILLLFWSADCNYCTETSEKLYSLYQNPEVQQILDIVAISIDETGTEIQKWKKKYPELRGWIHLRAADGLRSKAANDYYILGVPVMILIDEETKKIISMPEGTDQLNKLLNI
jgi:thiol-disulfide isomerase/thioredoxin